MDHLVDPRLADRRRRIAAGVTLGLLVLGLAYAVLRLVSRPAAEWAAGTVREGILAPIGYVALFLAGLAVLTAWSVPIGDFADSIRRVFVVGELSQRVTVPPRTVDYGVPFSFRSEELRQLIIASSEDLIVAAQAGQVDTKAVREVNGGDPYTWSDTAGRPLPFFGWVDHLYLTNHSDVEATVEIKRVTGVAYPEVACLLITAVALVALFGIYLAITAALPKLAAIAVATAKEASSQPIFYLALVLGAFALVVFIYIPYNTFGEDVKMLKDSGLTLILVLAVVVALWTASVSVAEEIEGRTALTLLSKPISRRQFVLGKFLGILWPVLLLFILLGLLFLVTVSYKVVYDARETARPDPAWQACYYEMIRTVPGLVLAFLETVVLVSIGVAISTRLPMLPNLIICASIYALGHLGPMIVNSSVGAFEPVAFVGRLIAVLLPVLDVFNIQAAIAAGATVPLSYLFWAVVYCVLYSSIAMLLALFLFEDRDLA